MSMQSPVSIDYVLDQEASTDEVEGINRVAREQGRPGKVKATYVRKAAEELPWVIFVLTPAILFLKGFLDEAGRDAYQRLSDFVSRMCSARRSGQGTTIIRDEVSGTIIVFASELPQEAYRQLFELNWERLEGRYWVWDSNKRSWDSVETPKAK